MEIRALDPRMTQPAAPAATAAEPAAATSVAPDVTSEAPVAAPADFVEINVPMRVPAELVQPDANGVMPLASYQPKLLPADAIITSDAEVKNLVDTVRKQAAPDGTHPELNMTAQGNKVEAGKKTFMKLAGSAGSLGVYSLMNPGGFLSIPAAVAAPLSVVGGTVGVVAGLEQAKEALNLKGYYEGLQAQGVETVPIQVPVKTAEGMQVENRDVPVADLVTGARDTAIVGGMQALSGVLMAAAGVGGGPIVAMASVGVTAASALFAARGQLAIVAKAAWNKLKSYFHKEPKQQPEAQQQAQQAQQAQAQQPEQVIVPLGKPAPPPSVEAPQQPTELYLAGEQPRPASQQEAV